MERHKTPPAHRIVDTPASTVNEPEAGRYVGMSSAFLRVARSQGRGPAYLRLGRSVRYRLSDLDAWLDRHRVNTREAGSR